MHTETSGNVVDAMAETLAEGTTLNPLHGAYDEDRLAELTLSMIEHGWIGAPVVAAGENALTGSHRIQAAATTDTPLRVVQVVRLCAEYGIDWAEISATHDYESDSLADLERLLPRDVVDYLGLDQY